jgi:hypothetical protein
MWQHANVLVPHNGDFLVFKCKVISSCTRKSHLLHLVLSRSGTVCHPSDCSKLVSSDVELFLLFFSSFLLFFSFFYNSMQREQAPSKGLTPAASVLQVSSSP